MATERRRVVGKQRTDHPTGRLISVAVAEILKEKGPAGFHVDDVLERTGLTRGAIYHHFDNVDDLIESGLVVSYSEGLGDTIAFVRDVLASAETFDAFRTGIFEANLIYVRNESLRAVRKLRAHTLSLADRTERMAALLASTQQQLTNEYVHAITRGQERGWVRADLDAQALAVFVQAYSFGIIIDDISETHLDPEAWARMIETFFDGSVFAPSS